MDNKIGVSLYTINKAAKQFGKQDEVFREHLKDFLFDNYNSFSNEEMDYITQDLNIDIDSVSSTRLSVYRKEIEKDDFEYLIYSGGDEEHELYEALTDNHIYPADYCDFKGLTFEKNSYKQDVTDLFDHPSEKILELIDETIGVFEEEFYDYIRIKNIIDELHNLFHIQTKFKIIKRNLYYIKGLFLERGHYPITEYHKDEHCSNCYLAYYLIDGFGFHHRIPMDSVDSDLVVDKSIGRISEVNKLPDDTRISLEEALSIIANELGISDIIDKILSGEDVIDILNNRGLKAKYHDFVPEYYDEENDKENNNEYYDEYYYDEYNDEYYDEDYDEEDEEYEY